MEKEFNPFVTEAAEAPAVAIDQEPRISDDPETVLRTARQEIDRLKRNLGELASDNPNIAQAEQAIAQAALQPSTSVAAASQAANHALATARSTEVVEAPNVAAEDAEKAKKREEEAVETYQKSWEGIGVVAAFAGAASGHGAVNSGNVDTMRSYFLSDEEIAARRREEAERAQELEDRAAVPAVTYQPQRPVYVRAIPGMSGAVDPRVLEAFSQYQQQVDTSQMAALMANGGGLMPSALDTSGKPYDFNSGFDHGGVPNLGGGRFIG